MMYANEARKMTIEVLETCTARDLAIIDHGITEAIEAGKFEVELKGSLKAAVKEKLEQMGYKVTYDTQYNETYCTISWRDL